jgi:hypothetical protein
MTKAELKRLTTGALGAVWRGPPSRGWCFFSIHLGECMGYGGRCVVPGNSRAKSSFMRCLGSQRNLFPLS